MDVWNDPSPSYHLNLELPVFYHPHPQSRTPAAEALDISCPLVQPQMVNPSRCSHFFFALPEALVSFPALRPHPGAVGY